ncbi:MAG: hypothetical protein ACK5Q5_20285, partial [Planctomycetaceae bacterium]
MSGDFSVGAKRCSQCGELIDKWNDSLDSLVIRKRKLDIGCTYDGITVVSCRFKSVCDTGYLLGLTFRQLPDDPEFFAVWPSRVVDFDADRRGTRFITQCSQCGSFESVVGATPVYLKPGWSIGVDEFARTNLEFGSADEKHPVILCGQRVATVLTAANLKGL